MSKDRSPETLISLTSNLDKDGEDLIRRAYNFARKSHKDQSRLSGSPYFTHVYETAYILAGLGMGAKTIAAGLLHDTLEDANEEEENVGELFGNDVLFLVKGVTKLGKIRYRGMKRHVESLRKLFVATSQDIRVLIIKLADRLHNMRTLEHIPKRKRRRVALETMEVYAPIAHRLGMGQIKGELEDLAFKHLQPEEYTKAKQISGQKYKESERELKKIHKKLLAKLAEEKMLNVRTDYRRKHLYSLWNKLQRRGNNIDNIYDISALRLIVPTVSDCYKALGIIHSLWRPLPGKIKDYIAFQKPNGYQSIHTTIFTGSGNIAEIQIRTEKMHREAEYGIASHVNYKSKQTGRKSTPLSWILQLIPTGGESEDDGTPIDQSLEASIPDWIKELAEAQKELSGPKEFMENLKADFFENRIFVFTPKGDVIDLPVGSSPVDFAYHVHTEIGNSMSGAKINGKMASIETRLNNGDIVEIVTAKSGGPTRKWLEYAKSTLARRKIRSAISEKKGAVEKS